MILSGYCISVYIRKNTVSDISCYFSNHTSDIHGYIFSVSDIYGYSSELKISGNIRDSGLQISFQKCCHVFMLSSGVHPHESFNLVPQ